MDIMKNNDVHHLFFSRKDLSRWDYPQSLLVLFLFFPSTKELPLTQLERLGIWAARQAREEVKKKINQTQMRG